ncbi:MAG: hypothetical protein M3Q51_01385 [Pseudomonadota bacterium]|nr:hypothetical protein [Pseudomonadota bacterium]
MSARFHFSLADHGDDAALRQRLAEDHMQGNISVSFRREPDYFLGCAVQGHRSEILKCTDASTGRIVGLGARHTTKLFVNGVETQVGYLSDLRTNAGVRRGTLLARGYSALASLHAADPMPLYFSIILDGNEAALAAITTARAGLPIYKNWGRILTPAIHLDRQRDELHANGISLRRGDATLMPGVFAFLKQELSSKQLAPCYSHEDLGTSRLLGLRPEDFYLAFRGNDIVGCVAAWDQSEFRQTHVERYSPALRRIRPFYNLVAKVSPLHALPAPGGKIPYFYLGLVASRNNCPDIFATLVRSVYRDRRKSGYHFMIAGLHESDPLCAVLADYRRIDAGGTLFLIYYPNDSDFAGRLDNRIPYVEMATA